MNYSYFFLCLLFFVIYYKIRLLTLSILPLFRIAS